MLDIDLDSAGSTENLSRKVSVEKGKAALTKNK
jgi:hypothetical protein